MGTKAEDFYNDEWPLVREKMINFNCSLGKALIHTSKSKFFLHLQECDELREDWEKVKLFCHDQLSYLMLDAFEEHNLDKNDPWASKKALTKVMALAKIKESFVLPEKKAEKVQVEISYED